MLVEQIKTELRNRKEERKLVMLSNLLVPVLPWSFHQRLEN
jgi:hypothetical protein